MEDCRPMNNDMFEQALRQHGWLRHVPADFADAVLALCQWRRVSAGEGIQFAGDGGGNLFGLGAGTVSMTTAMTASDAPITDIGHPGRWFGFVPLFGGEPRAITVEARSDVVLAVLSQTAFAGLLDSWPGSWRYTGMLGTISYGHIAANIAGDMMIRDSRRRCVAALLRVANCRFGDQHERTSAQLSQSEIAAIANLSRTTVNTILGELEADGLIVLGYRSVELVDIRLLRRIADEG
jgi:CRP/FNR family transcriptional regulator, cyclic AMP receptor protein